MQSKVHERVIVLSLPDKAEFACYKDCSQYIPWDKKSGFLSLFLFANFSLNVLIKQVCWKLKLELERRRLFVCPRLCIRMKLSNAQTSLHFVDRRRVPFLHRIDFLSPLDFVGSGVFLQSTWVVLSLSLGNPVDKPEHPDILQISAFASIRSFGEAPSLRSASLGL